MKLNSAQYSGISIILGSLFAMITMILHPVGGDLHHIKEVGKMGMYVHSLAIFSVPFLYLGARGLSTILIKDWFFANLGRSIFLFAIIAVMLAAAVNGLVLPFFVNTIDLTSQTEVETAQLILHYNFSLNRTMDLIFMAGVTLSMICWSVAVIKTGILRKALGFAGLIIGLIGLIGTLSGQIGTNLHGFTAFIFGFVVWTVWAGVEMCLLKRNQVDSNV